jgi:hypothetical protein
VSTGDEWIPPEDFPGRDLFVGVLAALKALHKYRDKLPVRAKSLPKDEAERFKLLAAYREQEEEYARLLGVYRARLREWAPPEPVACSSPRKGRCSHQWEGHACALKPGHPGDRAGAGHACGCGATSDGPVSNDNYWDPVKAGRQVRVIPCPRCADVRHMSGPSGEPQRRCWGCGNEWTPDPLAQATKAEGSRQRDEPIVMAAVP